MPKSNNKVNYSQEVKRRKMLSHRFTVETMFMAVVGRPQPHHKFNGNIFIRRVSKERYIGTSSSHTNFTHDAIMNDQIKKGD